MDKATISATTYQAVIEYLATQPYGRVYKLIAAMETERLANAPKRRRKNADNPK